MTVDGNQEEIVQWPCPLVDRLFFYEKIEFFMGCSVGFKYAKIQWRPGPNWGSSRHSPVPDLVGWGQP